MIGKIIKNISNSYTVLVNNEKIICTPRGKFRKEKIIPLVGDLVEFDKEKRIITKILPRKNELSRPNVTNLDYCLIVTSLKQPDFSSLLLDKLITNSLINNIKPIICFTKLDLINENELKQINIQRRYYEKIGIKTFDNENLEQLIAFLKNKVVVLTGQSGAGKSSLLNRLDSELDLKTNEISLALNRGKHTTRHCELFNIKNIWFCDTPGFSSLSLSNYSKEDIKNSFIEALEYECKFSDCIHYKEVGCQVKEAVLQNKIMKSRYQNYLNFLEEVSK